MLILPISFLSCITALCTAYDLGEDIFNSTNRKAVTVELLGSNISEIYTTLNRLEKEYANSPRAAFFFDVFRDRVEECQVESLRECVEELTNLVQQLEPIEDDDNNTMAIKDDRFYEAVNNATSTARNRFAVVIKYASELVHEGNETYSDNFDEEEKYIDAMQNNTEKFEDFSQLYNTSMVFDEMLAASNNFSEKWNETEPFERFLINRKAFRDETMQKVYELVSNLDEAYEYLYGVYNCSSSTIGTIFQKQQQYMAYLDEHVKTIIGRITDVEIDDSEEDYDDDDDNRVNSKVDYVDDGNSTMSNQTDSN